MTEADIVGGTRVSVRGTARLCATLISLGLVLGGGAWTWRLLEREAEGVPVIRADTSPMRIAPAEPGGDRAAHQGLSVSLIAAGAGDVPLADEVRLAPMPVAFAPEDMPEPPEPEVPQIDAMDLAVAEALGLDAATLIKASATTEPRAPRRVERQARAAVPRGGGEAVQLGAFPQEAAAAAEWNSLVARFPDLLEGTDRRIERVEREDRTFWRLRAGGFEDLADARRICAALMAGDAECIPVVRR